MLHEQLWKVLSFTGEVSTTVNLERREHADARLLITIHADNNHLFNRKATNKDAFEKTPEQFTKASGFLVKRRRGACKRMGLVTNGTLSSQTEIPGIPTRNFPKFFVNGKRPRFQVSRENTRSNGLLFYLCLLALGLLDDCEVEKKRCILVHRFFQLQSRRATPKQVNKGKRAIRLISYFRAKLGTWWPGIG